MSNTFYATITDAKICEDHGCLTTYIYLDCGCCLGGYNLSHWFADHEYTQCGSVLSLIMRTVGVDSWDKLKGSNVRIKCDDCGCVLAIGNLKDDKWFSFEEYFDEDE